MRQNVYLWLIGILVLALIAGFVDVSDTINLGIWQRDTSPRLGLDLKGGLQLVLQAEPRGNTAITADQLEAARNIIESRANETGASEPVVQTAEGNRILVELPGIQNLESARRVIQETAFLEIVDGGTSPPREGELICTTLGCPRPEQLQQASATPTGVPAAVVTGTAQITGTTTTGATATAVSTATATATPAAAGGATASPTTPSKIWTTIVKGDDLDGSQVSVQFNNNQPEVSFSLRGQAASDFATFTQNNIGNYMPIVLDNKVISAPVIRGAIIGGRGVINNINLADARVLAQQLKFGALPVSLTVQSERKISATLGQEAIDKSIVAAIVGLSLVALFMIVYYRLPGVLASVALIIYAGVAYAAFKLVPVTLTLAGIAGFILSIGMAVDANVLIFARLKDELRSGKTLGAAVEAGFDHAWPSIRDSNASTLITCAILFWFGSTFGGASIIKGFALTLAIGVIVSLFSAITVTRTFLRAIINTNIGKSRWAFNLETSNQAVPPATVTEA